MPFQCLCVGEVLNLDNILKTNDIPGWVQLARYKKALIAFKMVL